MSIKVVNDYPLSLFVKAYPGVKVYQAMLLTQLPLSIYTIFTPSSTDIDSSTFALFLKLPIIYTTQARSLA